MRHYDSVTTYTHKQLKSLAQCGAAVDVTNATDKTSIPELYTVIGFSYGSYGMNGALMVGMTTNRLYTITDRTPALFLLC